MKEGCYLFKVDQKDTKSRKSLKMSEISSQRSDAAEPMSILWTGIRHFVAIYITRWDTFRCGFFAISTG